MAEPKEPQSYGSEKEWVTGDVGEEVNRQKSRPSPEQGFYESRHGREDEGAGQGGGTVSPAQREETATTTSPRGARGEEPTVPKVTVQYSGAKRDGYFRDRDYK